MNENIVEEEEGPRLVVPSSIELAQAAGFDEAAAGGEEGYVEVRERALEVEDLEDVRVGSDLGLEVRSDWARGQFGFRGSRIGNNAPWSTTSNALLRSPKSG